MQSTAPFSGMVGQALSRWQSSMPSNGRPTWSAAGTSWYFMWMGVALVGVASSGCTKCTNAWGRWRWTTPSRPQSKCEHGHVCVCVCACVCVWSPTCLGLGCQGYHQGSSTHWNPQNRFLLVPTAVVKTCSEPCLLTFYYDNNKKEGIRATGKGYKYSDQIHTCLCLQFVCLWWGWVHTVKCQSWSGIIQEEQYSENKFYWPALNPFQLTRISWSPFVMRL